jgi:hypothetical protein
VCTDRIVKAEAGHGGRELLHVQRVGAVDVKVLEDAFELFQLGRSEIRLLSSTGLLLVRAIVNAADGKPGPGAR